jgi:hypothetical protein
MSTRTQVSALLITLGLTTGLAACSGRSADRTTAQGMGATTSSTSIASTETVSAPTASIAVRAPGTATSSPGQTRQPPSPRTAQESSTATVPERRFVCPKGGIEEAIKLQRAVDEGHQPWRTSPTDVVAACSFPDGAVEAIGVNTYRVHRVSTGQTVIVEVEQPVRRGPNGIWVVTKVIPR